MLLVTRFCGFTDIVGVLTMGSMIQGASYQVWDTGRLKERVFNPGLCFSRIPTTTDIHLGQILTEPSDCLPGENGCKHINLDGVIYPQDQFDSMKVLRYDDVFTSTLPSSCHHWRGVKTGTTTQYHFWPLLSYDTACSYYERGDRCQNDGTFYAYVYRAYVLFTDKNLTYYGVAWQNDRSGSVSTTYYCSIRAFEYDPLRGFRSYTFESDKAHPGYLRSTADLSTIVSSYVGTWTPSGGFSWSVRVMTEEFKLPTVRTSTDISALVKHYTESEWTSGRLLPVNLYTDVDWGELSYQALSSVQPWSSNGLALSKDYLGLADEVRSAVKILKNIDNPKAWADAFLSFKYGLRLTVSDTRTLIASMQHEQEVAHIGPAKASSSTNFEKDQCDCEAHLSIYYGPNDDVLSKLYTSLAQFDLFPDSKNIWDLIPFSFAVDWFVDIGGLLDRVDSCAVFSAYNVVAEMRSLKQSRYVPAYYLGFHGYVGSILLSRYERVISASPTPPKLVLDTPITQGFDHWIEAGALMVQKIFS